MYSIPVYRQGYVVFSYQYDLEGVFHTLLHTLTLVYLLGGTDVSVFGELISVQADEIIPTEGAEKTKSMTHTTSPPNQNKKGQKQKTLHESPYDGHLYNEARERSEPFFPCFSKEKKARS